MSERLRGRVESIPQCGFAAKSRRKRRRSGVAQWLNRLVLLILAGLLLVRWLRERTEQAGPPPTLEDVGIPLDRYTPGAAEMTITAEQPRTAPVDLPARPAPESARSQAETAPVATQAQPTDRPVREEAGTGEPQAGAAPLAGASQLDDLKVLEGIGPKISTLLRQAGITTYRQLGETEVSQLEAILRSAGLRLADPRTWPEQARLLAEGRRHEFQQLIDQLKAGRRA